VSRFKVGDRVRAMDFKYRTDCFVEIVINVVIPSAGQYSGLCVRDVCSGEEVPGSSRVGFETKVPMENAMHRDWNERLTLVVT
jgi:hypothetical protein